MAAPVLSLASKDDDQIDLSWTAVSGASGYDIERDGGKYSGSIAFVGIYEGDITADGSWADMETWVTDHYGITIA